MFETFDDHRSRYASGGIVQTLPSELIDSIWLIIDLDLKGFIPLTNLLTFEVKTIMVVSHCFFSSTKSNRTWC